MIESGALKLMLAFTAVVLVALICPRAKREGFSGITLFIWRLWVLGFAVAAWLIYLAWRVWGGA